jgi:phosphoserine phosphatase
MLKEEQTVATPRLGETAPDALPLVVDLDGTLIHSDLLWESLVLFLRKHFWRAWLIPFWLLKGKAGFKERITREIVLDPAALPYDKALLAMVRSEREYGRTTVLATGAQRRLAEQVAAHTGLFDTVLATEDVNLTSHNKARRLTELFGEKGYDYIGNSRADVPVWLSSRSAYCVAGKQYALLDGRTTTQVGSMRGGAARALFKALRPRQWL